MNLYDVAKQVTDEVCGPGTYAALNAHHLDPGVRAAIDKDPSMPGVNEALPGQLTVKDLKAALADADDNALVGFRFGIDLYPVGSIEVKSSVVLLAPTEITFRQHLD